jgi:hypothetical protein
LAFNEQPDLIEGNNCAEEPISGFLDLSLRETALVFDPSLPAEIDSGCFDRRVSFTNESIN